MVLTTEERAWVTERMKIYDIKYQEIYDELLDHILTAMEIRRREGNKLSVAILFQRVVDEHFGGYQGIEDLAKNQEKLHHKHVRDIFFSNLKGAFNWPVLIAALIVLLASSTFENTKPLRLVFGLSVFFLALSPVVYAFILLRNKITISKGKSSLFKVHIINQTAVPLMMLQAFIYVPNLIDEASGRAEFASIKSLSPMTMAGILIFLAIINYSYVKACRILIEKKLSSLAV